jgi:Ser/Thr protein kinase RdoA (MazF antagonist)
VSDPASSTTAGVPGPPDPGVPDPPDPERLCRAYDLGRPRGVPTIAARGELGRIWRLETDRGPWAVKELLRYDAAKVRDAAKADVAFQEVALAAGVPMPRPIRSVAGEVLTDVGEAGRERLVRIYSWVELARRDAAPSLVDVASILGRLHAVAPRDDRSMDGWFVTPPPAATWAGRMAAAESAGVTWAAALAGLVPVIHETLAATRPLRPGASITCHLDFNPENVLVDLDGRPVVVDWENSGPAPASQELASAVAEFVHEAAETASFLAAYEAAGGTGRLVDRTSFAMTAIVQANLVETYSRQALDPSESDEDQARAAHWIDEIAAQAFTVERVDEWLVGAGLGGSPVDAPAVG